VVFIAAVIYLAMARRGREEPDTLAERKEPALAS
jgi:hypothetical protein